MPTPKLTEAEQEYDQEFVDANSIFPDDDDGFLEASCGMTGDGHCELAGTEWCDWRCPISREATHNQVRAKP
jgi:hypothetical protein